MSDRLDVDAIEARAKRCLSHYDHSILPTKDVLALCARVRELEQENAGLPQRPTLEKLMGAIGAWEYQHRHELSRWADLERDDETIEARIRALYAEKADA